MIRSLAEFTRATRFDDLPEAVVEECTRLTLDSLGCAVGGAATTKGRSGTEVALRMGGASGEATILGTPHRSSAFGAAFANGELINALDFDAILPPGHVTPYVLPGALAEAEVGHRDGRSLITAIAVAHEIAYRFGRAMDGLRDVRDGVPAMPPVFGYSSTVFGAAAAIGILRGHSVETLADALGIAGMITPVNSFRSWCMQTPPTTLKYLSAGALTQAAASAAHLAELGQRGNPEILDDAEFGFPRYVGTARWEPEQILDGLGAEWRFTTALSYKPWPHARGSHGALDALDALVVEHDLKPEDITAVRAWGESFAATYPVWRNRDLVHVEDAQYSIVHALAVAAHRVPPGRAWQDPEVVFGPSVLGLMDRTTYAAHPDYAASVSAHAQSRPTRVEIDARDTTFVGECRYPKGTPSPEPGTEMSTEDVTAKFRANAEGLLPPAAIDRAIRAVLGLADAPDAAAVVRTVATLPDH